MDRNSAIAATPSIDSITYAMDIIVRRVSCCDVKVVPDTPVAIGADGLGVRRLTDDPATDDSPIWTPDGTKILFWSERNLSGGRQELYAMSPDGGEQIQSTTLNK